jgi:FkbM family methyltransferase
MAVIASLSRFVDNVKVAGLRGGAAYLATRIGYRAPLSRCAMRGGLPTASLRLGSADVQAYRQIFERQEYRCPLIHRPEFIVDAGAHIGLATNYFAHCFPSAEIVAIEPDPENFSILQHNTGSLGRVHAVQGALWDRAGPVRIVNPDAESWAFRVDRVTDNDVHDVANVVEGYTLDQILDMCGREHLDILKLDIEGAEKTVLAHAAEVLVHVDTIVAELHDRLVPGCSRTFYAVTSEFATEWRQGEVTGVSRRELVS